MPNWICPSQTCRAPAVVEVAQDVVTGAARLLAGSIDDRQVLAYDLAAAAVAGRSVLDYGANTGGPHRLRSSPAQARPRTQCRPRTTGVKPDAFDPVMPFLTTYRDPALLASLANAEGPRHRTATSSWRRLPPVRTRQVRPSREHVHRTNADIPGGICRAGRDGRLRPVPEEYGGFVGRR
jgi:hypothetical protein